MSLQLQLHELEAVARKAGYPDYRALLYDYYVTQGFSIEETGRRLGIARYRVRRHLVRFGITLRSKGGPNNVKIVVTKELLHEVALDGIAEVARRLGVYSPTLRASIQRYVESQQPKSS